VPHVPAATGGPSSCIHEGWAYAALSMTTFMFGDLPPQRAVAGLEGVSRDGASALPTAAQVPEHPR